MLKEIIIRGLVLIAFGIFYLIFTIRYCRILSRSIVFTNKIKVFHFIMIWLVPFVWILLLRALTKSTPGSYQVEKKSEPKPFSDNGGTMWTS